MENEEYNPNPPEYSVGGEEREEYHPLPPVPGVNSAHIQNDAGTYVKSEFGWIFLRSNDILPGTDQTNYEKVIHSNIQNLAMSEKGVKGRVTLDMLEDEPFAPVKENSSQDMVDLERPPEPEKKEKKKIERKSLILCCTSVGFMATFFLLDHLIQAFQYMQISISMGIAWIDTIRDLLKGLDIFSINLSSELYIGAVIFFICIILLFALFTCGGVFGFFEADCCCFDTLEEFTSMIIFEYFFFGFFAIPIMKMLLQTYDCVKDENNDRVLRRNRDWECESWYQILLFGAAMIGLVILIIGAVIRNLAKEEEMHFRTYEWRIKKGVKYILIKEMLLKAMIMVLAIFGPEEQYWPSLACCLLSFIFLAYWLYALPYVITRYNHVKVAMISVSLHCFFCAFLSVVGDDIKAFKEIASVLLFLFPISATAGFMGSMVRSKYVYYDEDIAQEQEELKKVDDQQSFSDKTDEGIYRDQNFKYQEFRRNGSLYLWEVK